MKRNDTKSPSQLKKSHSIGWQKESHMSSPKVDVLEVMVKENEEWQKKQKIRLKRMIDLKTPQILIDQQENISKMTLMEYESNKVNQLKLEEEEKKQYYKDNKMNKQVVEKILDFFKNEKDYIYTHMVPCPSLTLFATAYDPIGRFKMKEDDWFMGLYDDLVYGQLDKLYREKGYYESNWQPPKTEKITGEYYPWEEED